jgi:hypothetical protein
VLFVGHGGAANAPHVDVTEFLTELDGFCRVPVEEQHARCVVEAELARSATWWRKGSIEGQRPSIPDDFVDS